MKDIKKRRYISTVTSTPVHPDYISGLVQADGSFYISLKKTVSSRKIIPYAIFTLTQDLDSIGVLQLIQRKFACGHIYKNINKHSAELVVSTISELQSVIIPHNLSFTWGETKCLY